MLLRLLAECLEFSLNFFTKLVTQVSFDVLLKYLMTVTSHNFEYLFMKAEVVFDSIITYFTTDE